MPDQKLRVALIGCGRRALEHLAAMSELSDQVECVALCDLNPAALKRAAELAPSARTATDASALLADTPCDLIVVSLPPAVDRAPLIDAISAAPMARAVLIEKPAAASTREARVFLSGLEIPVFVCHQMRVLPWSAPFFRLTRSLREQGPVTVTGRCYGKLFDQGLHLLDLIFAALEGSPDEITSATLEDNPARISAQKPLPEHWRRDDHHPGSIHSDIEAHWPTGDRLSLVCGPCGADDWLDKLIRIEQGDNQITLTVDGLQLAGPLLAEEKNYTGGEASHRGATTEVYREFHRWVFGSDIDNTPPRLPGLTEHLNALSWCEAVSDFPRQDRLPAPGWIVPGGDDAPLTVVIPLSDHRDMAEHCIRSWTHGQQAAPESFRIVIVSNNDTDHIAERISSQLRDQDIILHTRLDSAALGQGDIDEYAKGIEATDSEWIFLTEPHCEAPANLVTEIRSYFATSEDAGFCSDCIDRFATPWGKMEGLYFGEGFREWKQPGNWAKMIVRGFGIRRTAYEGSGGLRLRYGRFSEWLLAADLHRQGYYLGFAEKAKVIHHYTPDKAYLDEAIEEFVKGQARYLAEVPEAERLPYFPNCAVEAPGPARWEALKKVAAHHITKPEAEQRRQLPPSTKARLTRDWNAFLVHLTVRWSPSHALPFFERYYEAQTTFAMWKYFSDYASMAGSSDAIRPGHPLLVDTTGLPTLPGLLQRERFGGLGFHWCNRILGIPLAQVAGDLTLNVDLLPIASVSPERCPVLVTERNPGHPVTPEIIVEESHIRLRFSLPSHGTIPDLDQTWVALASSPIEVPKAETRELALPVTGISVSVE